ncbi:hypothetical protein J6590_030807 [Homalodisca vitripennis]|nr:hypothetical protein J6590_030807 [Homalodisca vitripennis]
MIVKVSLMSKRCREYVSSFFVAHCFGSLQLDGKFQIPGVFAFEFINMLYGDAISDDLLEDECCQDRAAAGHLKSDLTWSSSSVYLWRINLQRNVLVTILALGSTWESNLCLCDN